MTVQIEPAELGFKRPFHHEVAETLSLKNPLSNPIAFKVKTTAPKQYCVRPNSGRIEPNSQVDVQVLLQAMREDPPPEAKCRDKFLVQSVGIPSEIDGPNVASIWQQVEQTAKRSIEEKKIRVNYLAADATPASASHDASYADDSTMVGSPSPEAVTPQRARLDASGSFVRPDDGPAESRHVGEAVDSAYNPSTSSAHSSVQLAPAAVASNVANAAASTAAETQRRLTTGRDEVKEQVRETAENLRRRTNASIPQPVRETALNAKEDLTTALGVQQAPTAGVPVPMVAMLCLFSFLLAYFFF